MKILVVFDSQFGNTKKVAEKIARSVRGHDQAKAVHVDKVEAQKISNYDLVVIGSPTQGGRATLPVTTFITSLSSGLPTKFACFDTRFPESIVGIGLKLLMKIIGYAAPKMVKQLQEKKLEVIASQAFFVSGTEGPLLEDELSRAAQWAKQLTSRK